MSMQKSSLWRSCVAFSAKDTSNFRRPLNCPVPPNGCPATAVRSAVCGKDLADSCNRFTESRVRTVLVCA